MASLLRESLTAGVFVEFLDAGGNCQGQAVFVDWRGRPLPAAGDTLSAQVVSPSDGQSVTLCGRVLRRHFELQRDEEGRAEVWVRLEVRTAAPGDKPVAATRPAAFTALEFSDN